MTPAPVLACASSVALSCADGVLMFDENSPKKASPACADGANAHATAIHPSAIPMPSRIPTIGEATSASTR